MNTTKQATQATQATLNLYIKLRKRGHSKTNAVELCEQHCAETYSEQYEAIMYHLLTFAAVA